MIAEQNPTVVFNPALHVIQDGGQRSEQMEALTAIVERISDRAWSLDIGRFWRVGTKYQADEREGIFCKLESLRISSDLSGDTIMLGFSLSPAE